MRDIIRDVRLALAIPSKAKDGQRYIHNATIVREPRFNHMRIQFKIIQLTQIIIVILSITIHLIIQIVSFSNRAIIVEIDPILSVAVTVYLVV